jgi:hypothetical protein
MTMFMARLRNETGIAMVTVLLVGAALTASAGAAAFVTVQDLKATTDDSRGSSALAYAEGGIDRLILDIRRGLVTWYDIRLAGCTTNPANVTPDNPQGRDYLTSSGQLGQGTFKARLEVYTPPTSTTPAKYADTGACTGRSGSPPRYKEGQNFVITSVGEQPTARRVVRSVVKISARGFPVGVFARRVQVNGTPNLVNISLISDGDVLNRSKYAVSGTDLYYRIKDFWPSVSGATGDQRVPAGVHTIAQIYTQNSATEHPAEQGVNCIANRNTGTEGQSQWDQSGYGGTITRNTACPGQSLLPPPSSKMVQADLDRVAPTPKVSDQDYLTLKAAAKQDGIYCYIATTGATSCTKKGAAWSLPSPIQSSALTGLAASWVAYFEYQDPSKAETGNLISWNANVGSTSSCTTPYQYGIIVVRNGSFHINGNTDLNGVLLVPEGKVTDQGTFTINGTIIAKSIESGGDGTFQMNQCWLDHLPGPFLDATTSRWSEVDR